MFDVHCALLLTLFRTSVSAGLFPFSFPLVCTLASSHATLQQGGLWCEVEDHPVTWYVLVATLKDPTGCVDYKILKDLNQIYVK